MNNIVQAYEKFQEEHLIPLSERGESFWDGWNNTRVYREPTYGRDQNGKPIEPPDFGGGI